MKRLIIYSIVLAGTFSTGIMIKAILTPSRHVAHTSKSAEIEIIAPSTVQPTIPISDYAFGRFNPSGDYYPVNRMIAESEKSTYFDLKARRVRGKLMVSGELKNHSGRSYKFASISITEQRLKFRTVNIQGVEYRFDGTFLGTGDFARRTTDEGKIMLEGVLQKFIKGEKVAETNSAFLYFPGC